MWVFKSNYLKIFFVIALIIASIFSWCSLEILPKPKSLDANASEFSAARAHEYVKRMTRGPRRLGSSAHENAKNFLLGELALLGCNVFIQKTFSSTSFRSGVFAGPVENILCVFKGKKEESVLLMSHYDSVHLSPGAGDAASGVSIILETARALSQSPHENSLLLLFTDGEESGLLGAAAFVKSELHKKYNAKTILNFEARGNSGPFALFETHNFNTTLSKASEKIPKPIGNSFMDFLYQFLPNETDLSVFKSQNISAMNFAFARGLEHYHKSSDTAENLSLESLQHAGESAVSTTQFLLNTNLIETSQSPKVLYQDIFGKIHLSYSPLLIKILAAIMSLVLLLYLILKAPKSLKSTASIAIVAVYFFLVMLVTSLSHSLIVQLWTSNSVITDFYLFFAAFALLILFLSHTVFLKLKKFIPEIHYGLCFFLLIFLLFSFVSVELGSLIVWSSLGVCLHCIRGSQLTRVLAIVPMAVLLPEFLHSALIADSGTQFTLPTFVLFFSVVLLHIVFDNPYNKASKDSSPKINQSRLLVYFHSGGIATGLMLFVFLSFKHGFNGDPKRAEFFEILSEDKLYIAINKSKKIKTLFNQKVDLLKKDYLISHLSRWRIQPSAFDLFESGSTLARPPTTLYTQWGQAGASFNYILDIPVQDYECVHLLLDPEIPIFDLKVNGQSPYFVTRKKYARKDPPGPEFIESCSLRNVPLRLEFKSQADKMALRELLAIFTQNTEAPGELGISPKSTIMSFFSNTLFVLKKIAL